eukprot:TRINITY_DN7627_c0_g1_i1.p2 TRINITY_DN7627_c0_g1~~TRINITY_DN7627_c0_g1_i1.p2  ORF type:complete len:213 (+),score=59.33 TRINITY_DN7627_c0_g1_i1:68-706(+)
MEQFTRDCVRFGTYRGFVHFSLYVRSQEELLVSIHGVESETAPDSNKQHEGSGGEEAATSQLNQSSCPEDETESNDSTTVVYLIAGYAKYKRPYVWLRSPAAKKSKGKDAPLKLKSTDRWKKDPRSVRVWGIVGELVRKQLPGVGNPFALDFQALEGLPLEERAIRAGALASFLYEDLLSAHSSVPPESFEEWQRVLECHFTAMASIRAYDP